MATFKCVKCNKEINLQDHVYEEVYKDRDICFNCKPRHGGAREGSGRPALGKTKKVSITLPEEIWDEIEQEKGDLPMSAFLRELILNRSRGEES